MVKYGSKKGVGRREKRKINHVKDSKGGRSEPGEKKSQAKGVKGREGYGRGGKPL